VTLTHRPVEPRDIEIICGFPQNPDELFFMFPKAAYPLTPAQLKEAISERSDSTKVAGFANFHRWETHGACSIGNVAVAPAARGRGVGRYLIQQMIGLAFSKHLASEATISCFNQNVVGLLLYSKLGFQPCSMEERQDKRGNRVALIHLRLLRPAP
jgi:ribosomal protein S18 acetylase RimI-like enzyme